MTAVETELELTCPVVLAHEIEGESVRFDLRELTGVLNRVLDLIHAALWAEPCDLRRIDRKMDLLARRTYDAWTKDVSIPIHFAPLFFWTTDVDPVTGLFAKARLAYFRECEGLEAWLEFLNRAARRDLGLYFKGYVVYPDYDFKSTVVQFYSPLSDLPSSHTLDEIMNNQLVQFLNASSYMPVMAKPPAGFKRVTFSENTFRQ